jgi:hypothetical protein
MKERVEHKIPNGGTQMNRSVITLGTVALACAFSSMAFAAGVEVRPRPRVDEIKTPGAFDAAVKTTPQADGLKFNTNTGTATNTQQPGQAAETCPSADVIASEVIKTHPGTTATVRSITDHIKRGTIQLGKDACAHNVNGLVIKGPLGIEDTDALNNLDAMATEVEQICPVGAAGAQLDGCWKTAEKDVLNIVDPVFAAQNLNKIKENCGGVSATALRAL